MKISELFTLNRDVDNPIFEGFALEGKPPSLLGGKNLLSDITPWQRTKPPKLSQIWIAPRVEGRVAPFNDFPCLNLLWPVFSRRACDVLRDFLEPNGELLPLKNDVGEYYLYHVTTMLDALDLKSSIAHFGQHSGRLQDIEHFVFHEKLLEGNSIFLLADWTNEVIVSDEFVGRVTEAGLTAFFFQKIWPLPSDVNWRLTKEVKANIAKNEEFDQHTLVVSLKLEARKPTKEEKKAIKRLESELNAQLAVQSLNSRYFGSYEAFHIVNGEYRMFVACPEIDSLYHKLLPWIKSLAWANGFRVVKRLGRVDDAEAPEQVMDV